MGSLCRLSKIDLCTLCLLLLYPGIEGGFDVDQDQYEEEIKVVILPDRQEVTSEDLATMPDVVRERVRRYWFCIVTKRLTSYWNWC